MNDLHKEEKGLTLVEMILSLALVAMVLSGFMGVFWFGSKAFGNENSSAYIQYEARRGRDVMLNDIRCSESLNVYTNFGDESTVAAGSSGSCLEAVVCEVDGLNTEYTGVYYYEEHGNMYRHCYDLKDISNQDDDVHIAKTPVAENIDSLSFVKPFAGTGLIEFSINAKMDDSIFLLEGSCRSRVDYSLDHVGEG